ncbi:hypothetical protein B0H11DRAFT_2118375 [Mycena galericulata]|nr:hypothetical protein B0H11DRAFT_2118375 [Mycena galericulata]
MGRGWRHCGTSSQSAPDGLHALPHPTMILFILTTLIPAALAVLPGLSRRPPLVIDSPENCRFNLGSRRYDLCPILDGTADQSLLVKGEGEGSYLFHLGSEDIETGSSRDACPSGTRICLISGDPESDLPIAISDASTLVVYPGQSDESITLEFSGGFKGAAVRVRLICDYRADSINSVYSRVEDALPLFTWYTKYGCDAEELSSKSILHALDSESGDPLPGQPAEPSKPKEDSEQLLEGDRQRNSRRSTAVILLIISVVIISLSIISYRHPQRINILLTQYVKPILQRLSLDNLPRISIPHSLKPAGEGRLMRWAHEDLELDEDFMVNGSDAPDEPDETGDEQIPLRPSPRKGGRAVKNYGSAPSPFW